MIELGVFLPVLSNGWADRVLGLCVGVIRGDGGAGRSDRPHPALRLGGAPNHPLAGACRAAGGTAALQGIAYIGITPLIASYAQCAAILDRIGAVPGSKGVMLIFPECLAALQEFGERVFP